MNDERMWKFIHSIKNPKDKAAIKKDFERLLKLKMERDRQNKISKYKDKFKSTKVH